MNPEPAHPGITPRLRLDELLRELHAQARTLTVGELVDNAAEGGFGLLVGVLALIAIPFIGLSTPFGLALALIGSQMTLGRRKPWLPLRARRRVLSVAMLDRVSKLLTGRMRWLTRSTRRRWEVAIRTRLVGLGVMILAIGLALPLPIPGSNLIFLVPLFGYAIGMIERDGVWIAISHLAVVANVVLLVVFSETVVAVFRTVWEWLH